MSISFPSEFLLGTSLSAHQAEGNNTDSDYWIYENVPSSEFVEPSGVACDHYRRYQDDIELIASLGLRAFRFSIEWARIEPRPGEIQPEQIQHYRRVAETCIAMGLVPIATLHHFTSPQWVISQGGWASKKTAVDFADYASRIAEELGELIPYFCTLNEVNGGRVTELTAMFGSLEARRAKPWVKDAARVLDVPVDRFTPWNFASTPQSVKVIGEAHRRAVDAIRRASPQSRVGLTIASQEVAATPGADEMAEVLHNQIENEFYRFVEGDDFLGVQSYTRWLVDESGALQSASQSEATDMGYEVRPEALGACVRNAHNRTGLPILVTENGIGTTDDSLRIRFVKKALEGLYGCMRDDIPVLGYLYWTAFDNFEWEFGFEKQFGLIGVQKDTLERSPKPSAHWFGSIAKTGEIT